LKFEWDPEKDRINKKIHGISFSTAKFVFNDMVKETLRAGQKPTKKQLEEIWAAEKKPVTYSTLAPKLTDEELAQFKKVNAENRKKISCTIRISKKTLDWWKSLGEGYTGAMARTIEIARNYPEILREII